MSTKNWQKKHDAIESAIMDGYRRGVCNKNGESVKVNGVYIGKPRNIKPIRNFDPTDTFLQAYRRGEINVN